MTLHLESINLCNFASAGPMKITGEGRDWCYYSYRMGYPVPIEDIDLLCWIVASSGKMGDGDRKLLEECRFAALQTFEEVSK